MGWRFLLRKKRCSMADRQAEPKADEGQESKSVLRIEIKGLSIESQNVGTRGQLFALLAGLVSVVGLLLIVVLKLWLRIP
jgi:hypothetical protein